MTHLRARIDEEEWTAWIRISLFVIVLLGAMLLTMWGVSVDPAR